MISTSDYKIVSDNIALINNQEREITSTAQEISDLASAVADSTIYEQTISAFVLTTNQFYNMTVQDWVQNEDIYRIVERLQEHIIAHYSTDINSFLSDNGIKVKATFADISSEVGFDIDPSNVE